MAKTSRPIVGVPGRTDPVEIRVADPRDPAMAGLIERHLTLMYASSPACSVHAMAADALAEPGILFLAAYDGDQAIAMGALKPLSGNEGELKSMHVIQERRGAGLADAILMRLIQEAEARGMLRVSLETGSQDAFRAARAFYSRHGFELCAPFEGYTEDPASVFYTRAI